MASIDGRGRAHRVGLMYWLISFACVVGQRGPPAAPPPLLGPHRQVPLSALLPLRPGELAGLSRARRIQCHERDFDTGHMPPHCRRERDPASRKPVSGGDLPDDAPSALARSFTEKLSVKQPIDVTTPYIRLRGTRLLGRDQCSAWPSAQVAHVSLHCRLLRDGRAK